jgi:hypothetical protein
MVCGYEKDRYHVRLDADLLKSRALLPANLQIVGCARRSRVEVIEVAKASLDHGEQMLAVARQKALRLASIEGRKPFGQQPPCLRWVIVRVGDEMDSRHALGRRPL